MRVALSAIVAGLCLSLGVPAVAVAAPTTTEPVERPLSSSEVMFGDRSDIVDAAPLTFSSWSRLDDGMRVYFLAGTPTCYGVHATATETADAVTVRLQEGLLPEAANRRCTANGVLAAIDVDLDAPVGDRRVLATS
ncbi:MULTISPECIES: hypothetical protein [Mycobacteriaceae]|uniref:hypothetical protein n=1 Tax=Mycobacteriaceae TaxID=1762 RepID=UPI000801D595|nr:MULTISPECIES: hypothetical protein [Mycobacteriaceae]MCK0174277.1 hypothetical protein [Mycolicibacterium sp. F2034L]OBB60379.1 hypothetical protein A5757_09835 [Mycobacterium sp. 852013-51886_SCH5428379]